MGTYCQELNQVVVVANLSTIGTFTCHLLVEKAPNLWKKTQIVDTQVQYRGSKNKGKVNEKFITFPKDHWIPIKDELRGKTYCKYHNSWNHTTNAC